MRKANLSNEREGNECQCHIKQTNKRKPVKNKENGGNESNDVVEQLEKEVSTNQFIVF